MTNLSYSDNKFLFDRDLLVEIAQEQEQKERQKQQAAKPAEPTFTQSDIDAQLEQAKKEAFDQGLQQGIEQGKQEAFQNLQDEFNQKVQPIIDKLSIQEGQYHKLIGHAQESALILVQEMLKRLFPKVVENFQIELTEQSIKTALKHTYKDIHFKLRVNPESIQWVQEKIDINAPLFNGKNVELVPDSQIAVGDCISEWDSAGVRVSLRDALDEMDHILQAAVGNAHTPPTEEMIEHLKTLDQARQNFGHQENIEQPAEPELSEQEQESDLHEPEEAQPTEPTRTAEEEPAPATTAEPEKPTE